MRHLHVAAPPPGLCSAAQIRGHLSRKQTSASNRPLPGRPSDRPKMLTDSRGEVVRVAVGVIRSNNLWNQACVPKNGQRFDFTCVEPVRARKNPVRPHLGHPLHGICVVRHSNDEALWVGADVLSRCFVERVFWVVTCNEHCESLLVKCSPGTVPGSNGRERQPRRQPARKRR